MQSWLRIANIIEGLSIERTPIPFVNATNQPYKQPQVSSILKIHQHAALANDSSIIWFSLGVSLCSIMHNIGKYIKETDVKIVVTQNEQSCIGCKYYLLFSPSC